MHKSTALIIITIIHYYYYSLYLFKNPHPLPAGEIARAVLTKKIVRNQPENVNCENQEKIFSYKRFLLAKTYGLW